MAAIPKSLKALHKQLPKFPDGRIDYTNASKAAILVCFVEYNGKILLLKRSDKVGTYRGLWNTVAGYLDELKPLDEKVREELEEELGIQKAEIDDVKLGQIYEFTDSRIQKTWIVHPTLVKLKNRPVIKLDWEHTKYAWINPDEINNYEITPRLDESLKKAK